MSSFPQLYNILEIPGKNVNENFVVQGKKRPVTMMFTFSCYALNPFNSLPHNPEF